MATPSRNLYRAISFRTMCLAFSFSLLTAQPAQRALEYTVQEEAPVDTFIGNVSADTGLRDMVGEAEFNSLRYSILSAGSPQTAQLFKISPTLGVLSVGGRVDREALCPYVQSACRLTLEIAAQYESLLRKFSAVVTVLDINDNVPTFPRPGVSLRLSESTAVGFSFSLDAASDLDGTGNFSVRRYALSPEDAPFSVRYEVNLLGVPQLSLVVKAPLDRETRDRYSLTVVAYDGGEPARSGSVAVTVNVEDVNDNAPRFTQTVYRQNISEATPPNTPILSVSASDNDLGNNSRVIYSISTQQPEENQRKFKIGAESGVVSTALPLTTIGVHRVLVEAQDQGSPPNPPTQALVEVEVLDTDNSPPLLSLDLLAVQDLEKGLVPESTKVSTAVGYLAVSDPDTGANSLVTCRSQNSSFELQSLNLDEYKVILSQPLDREVASYVTVVLACHDGGSPPLTSTVAFDIFVQDVNDNPPSFLERQYVASVAENNGAADGILQVAATDPDAGRNANITFRLADIPSSVGSSNNGDGDSTFFQIHPTAGMIKARTKLDYETKSRYDFLVLAVDQGEPSLTATTSVVIKVLDINDVAPMFDVISFYNMSVREGDPTGTIVGNVSAHDPDTGEGGVVDLSIVPQPGLALPFILSPAGVLSTTTSLDREQRASYSFYLVATDRGVQPLSSSVLVNVLVLDVNDNAPTFVFTTDAGGSGSNNASSGTPDTVAVPIGAEFVVAGVHAVDADAGDNALVVYAVAGGNASHLFRVEPGSGAVVTLTDLDLRHVGLYYLLVRAEDRGRPHSLYADRNVLLKVAARAGQGQGGLSAGGSTGAAGGARADGEQYVVIVVCIVVFTVVVSMAVLVTMCVLRKMDRDRKLKYTSAQCCPPDSALPHHGALPERDPDASFHSSADYQQQLPASMGSGPKSSALGGSVPESGYSLGKPADSGTFHSLMSYQQQQQQQRGANIRTSQLNLQLPQVTSQQSLNGQPGRRTPLQVDLGAVRRADDFHSTSSTETTTGDSGHGSDEDLANHSVDSQFHHLHHPHLQNPGQRPRGQPNHYETRPMSPYQHQQQYQQQQQQQQRRSDSSGMLTQQRPMSPLGLYQNTASQPPPPRPLKLVSGTTSTSSLAGRSGSSSAATSDSPTFPLPPPPPGPSKPAFSGLAPRGSKQQNSVRFSEVNSFRDAYDNTTSLCRSRYGLSGGGGGGGSHHASSDSLDGSPEEGEESDLNTTTSGSFSVPPDDLYDSLRQQSGEGAGPFHHSNTGLNAGSSSLRSTYDPHDMVV